MASLGGDPSGKGLSGSGGSVELCQAAVAKEQEFFEVSDSLCQAAAAKVHGVILATCHHHARGLRPAVPVQRLRRLPEAVRCEKA